MVGTLTWMSVAENNAELAMMKPVRAMANATPRTMSAFAGFTFGIGMRPNAAPAALPTEESAEAMAFLGAAPLTGADLRMAVRFILEAGILTPDADVGATETRPLDAGFATGLSPFDAFGTEAPLGNTAFLDAAAGREEEGPFAIADARR